MYLAWICCGLCELAGGFDWIWVDLIGFGRIWMDGWMDE
jgi:hypothetical protein